MNVRPSAPPHRFGPGSNYPSKPNPSSSIVKPVDKGKAPETPKTSRPVCFRCQKEGHFASTCPTRSLHIGKPDEEEEPESTEDCIEEVYEADPVLVNEY